NHVDPAYNNLPSFLEGFRVGRIRKLVDQLTTLYALTGYMPRTPRTSAMRRLSPCKTAAKCSRGHQSPTDGDRERHRRTRAQGPAGRSSALCASPTSVLCLAVPHYFILLYCPFILSKRFLYFVCSDVLTMLLSALTSILPIRSNLDSM